MITYILILFMYMPSEALYEPVGVVKEFPTQDSCLEAMWHLSQARGLPEGYALSCQQQTTL